MLKVGVLASGRGSNLAALLQCYQDKSISAKVMVVISDSPEAQALVKARKQKIPAFHMDPGDYPTKAEYNLAIVERLQEYGVKLVVLAGYMRILHPLFLESFPNRVINIHPSLLPAFPGLHAQAQALNYGVKYSGCTVHFVDPGMDTGPIIAQAVVPVLPNDDENLLAQRILKEEHKLLPQVVGWFAEGKIELKGRQVLVERK
jgi:phosphoribosylglycinamide formyltransferase-1